MTVQVISICRVFLSSLNVECIKKKKKIKHENEEKTNFSDVVFVKSHFHCIIIFVSVNKLQDFTMKMVYVCSFSVSHLFSCVPVDGWLVGWLVGFCSHRSPRSPVFVYCKFSPF